jgi:cardiolipin synthase
VNTWAGVTFPRVTLHSLAIVVSLLTYVLTTRVESERRPPAIAISWVLGLLAVPYLALPLYLMFGRRKVQRGAAPRIETKQAGRHWAEDLIDSFGLPPAAPARVRLHADGAVAHRALLEVLGSARARLDLCTYILGSDPVGREVATVLLDRARAGVRVRLLLDGVGAIQLPRAIFRHLNAGGVETAIFSPLLARRTSGPRNLRNHRKLVIADEVRLWAGGRNLAAEYFMGARGEPPWRDLSFDLDGPVAAAAARQFESDWVSSRGRPATPLSAGGQPPEDPADTRPVGRVQFLPSGPDQTEDTVHALLIDACFRAERRLLAVTPYFVPDASLAIAMRLAARRGVKIDLCLPASSNHILADFARSRALRGLAAAGVAVHLLPSMVHAKAVVFDESIAICGSPNLDSRSLLLNYESAFVFYEPAEIDWLKDWIRNLIPESVPFDARPPGLLRDIAEGLLLTVGYQL